MVAWSCILVLPGSRIEAPASLIEVSAKPNRHLRCPAQHLGDLSPTEKSWQACNCKRLLGANFVATAANYDSLDAPVSSLHSAVYVSKRLTKKRPMTLFKFWIVSKPVLQEEFLHPARVFAEEKSSFVIDLPRVLSYMTFKRSQITQNVFFCDDDSIE